MTLSKDNLLNIKNKVCGGGVSVADEIYFLAKEFGLGDLIGREFEFIKRDGEIVGFRQKPLPISSFITLRNMYVKDLERQNKASKRKR